MGGNFDVWVVIVRADRSVQVYVIKDDATKNAFVLPGTLYSS